MTDDDILRMAREAGGTWEYNRSHPVPCVMFDQELIKFAKLIAAKEREECASICFQEGPSIDGELIAAAIRARGEE